MTRVIVQLRFGVVDLERPILEMLAVKQQNG